MKNVIKTIGFISCFLLTLSIVTIVMINKPFRAFGENVSLINGYYHEESNSVDVLYIGSSHMFASISPLDIYKDYGFTGYVRGSANQKIWASETLLKDSIQYQKPKVLVLEVMMAYDMNPQAEGFNREVYDYIRPSVMKFQDINAMISEEEDIFSYMFPITRYHARWKELTQVDFEYITDDKHMYTKGFIPTTGVSPVVEFVEDLYSEEREPVYFSEEAKEYFYNIKKICDENGIQLVLFKAPTQFASYWDMGKHKGTVAFAEELGVPFIDMNVGEYKVDIDWGTETPDVGNHLNYIGAMKCSKALGQWLSENYDLTDHRNDEIGKTWDADYQKYLNNVNITKMRASTTFSEYMSYLKDLDYLVILSSKEDALNQISDADKELLLQIGCTLDYTSGKGALANIWIADGRDICISEQAENDIIGSIMQKGNLVEYTSSSFSNENIFEVEINDTIFSLNSRGLNCIVYDLEREELVDSCYFLFDEMGNFNVYR